MRCPSEDELINCGTFRQWNIIQHLKMMSYQACEKTWRNCKCISLREISQAEKATYRIIPTMWHSGKGKTSIFRRNGGEKFCAKHKRIFRAVKYSICYWNDGYTYNSISLCLLHSVLQGHICLLLQVSLDFLLLLSSPLCDFHHQMYPLLGVVFTLAQPLHSFCSCFSTLLL